VARGVPIPEVREQLFAAADRVLGRDGPGGLTTRAVTAEAGVSNGVLHRHFRDLDDFLAAFAATRVSAIADAAAALPGRAGRHSVTANLTDATAELFGPGAQALMTLIAARPELGLAMSHASDSGGLGDIERHFAAYLDAEKKLGRIGPAADTEALAFALLGTAHHLAITRPGDAPGLRTQVQRIVAALETGMDAGTAPPPGAPDGPQAGG
jgi:AcrR family transcriptional regulator